MKKILLSVLLITMVTAGFSTKWTITNSGFTFSPATITITVGDSVNFSIAGIHNAVEVSQATWNANGTTPLPGFSVPFGGGLVLPAQLTVGTHYYVCTAHVASMGMKGTITVQNSTGITGNPAKTNFMIYPNPSNGKFQLEAGSSPVSGNYDLEIYNMVGDKIYTMPGLKPQVSNQIDLSGFPLGIYFIRIYDGTEITDKKIIIQ